METKVKKAALLVWDYSTKLKEAIILLAFYGGAVLYPFNPDLDVLYTIERFYPPINIGSALERIPDSNAAQVWADFLDSEQILNIIVNNRKSKTINGFELEIKGVRKVTGVSGASTSLRLQSNLESLLSYRISDNGSLSFTNMNTIPPRCKLSISLYGSFAGLPFSKPIEARASVNEVRIGQMGKLVGFPYFCGRNAGLILFILFVILILVGLRRMKDDGI
jgi:hypothetical protein